MMRFHPGATRTTWLNKLIEQKTASGRTELENELAVAPFISSFRSQQHGKFAFRDCSVLSAISLLVQNDALKSGTGSAKKKETDVGLQAARTV
jgi:hypothetical protein